MIPSASSAGRNLAQRRAGVQVENNYRCALAVADKAAAGIGHQRDAMSARGSRYVMDGLSRRHVEHHRMRRARHVEKLARLVDRDVIPSTVPANFDRPGKRVSLISRSGRNPAQRDSQQNRKKRKSCSELFHFVLFESLAVATQSLLSRAIVPLPSRNRRSFTENI